MYLFKKFDICKKSNYSTHSVYDERLQWDRITIGLSHFYHKICVLL